MGAFGGFLGGMGQGVSNLQQEDGVGPGGQKQGQQGAGQAGGAGGLFGGQWGILPIIKNALGGGGPSGSSPAVANTTAPQAAIPSPSAGSQGRFNGVPGIQSYIAGHQARVQDASAQPHISSLQDPTITPEQQAYHMSNLQQIYANRPEMLKQYGLQPPTPVSLGQPQGASNVSTPTAQPVNLGQNQSRTSMTVTSPGSGMGSVATNY